MLKEIFKPAPHRFKAERSTHTYMHITTPLHRIKRSGVLIHTRTHNTHTYTVLLRSTVLRRAEYTYTVLLRFTVLGRGGVVLAEMHG